jgi:hypothetical protein
MNNQVAMTNSYATIAATKKQAPTEENQSGKPPAKKPQAKKQVTKPPTMKILQRPAETKVQEDTVKIAAGLEALTIHTSTAQKPQWGDELDQEEDDKYVQSVEPVWQQQQTSYRSSAGGGGGGGGRQQYYRTSRYNQRPESDGYCGNADCNNATDLRYCSDCYSEYQSRKQQCANDGCTLLTVARYCRDCRVVYRRTNHYCEACKDVLTESKWCKGCFAGFRSCAIEECGKKVQPRFTHCWEHFQDSIKHEQN